MRLKAVILILCGCVFLSFDGVSQEFTDKKFTGCGLNYEAITARLSLRASNSDSRFEMDTMPVKMEVSVHKAKRELIKAYLFASVSGSNTTFSPVMTDADSVEHLLNYEEIETGDDPCWSYSAKHLLTYDVTDFLLKNGDYYFSGFPLSSSWIGTDTDGLMLMMIYSDPFEPFIGNLYFSKGVIASNLSSASYIMKNITIDETSTAASGFMLVADLQDQGSKISINNSSLFGITKEEFWDYETKNTAVFANQTTSTFKLSSPNDCAHLLVTGLYFQQPKEAQIAIISQIGDTLTASSAFGYEWYLNGSLLPQTNAIIVATYPGNYKVVTEDVAGCKYESSSIDITCFENFVPIVNANGRTLKIDSFYTAYQWFRNDTLLILETNDSIVANDSASYYVSVIDSLGCEYKSNITTFNSPNGVENLSYDLLIRVYPNPSFGQFYIAIGNNNDVTQISITSLEGKIIYYNKEASNLKNLSIEVTSGIYFLNVQKNNESVVTKKIIVH